MTEILAALASILVGFTAYTIGYKIGRRDERTLFRAHPATNKTIELVSAELTAKTLREQLRTTQITLRTAVDIGRESAECIGLLVARLDAIDAGDEHASLIAEGRELLPRVAAYYNAVDHTFQ
jgi:hypothetical protein